MIARQLFGGHASRSLPSIGENYTATAQHAAAVVIKRYSNSFSLATRVLREPVRTHIRNLYALVRIADELVDGVAEEFGHDPTTIRKLLDDYESTVYQAMDSGFSTDLIVHAFAHTARTCEIDSDHVRHFFTSMRKDTEMSIHSADSVDEYVYGSAEVIGQMCNAIFAYDARRRGNPWSAAEQKTARIGAAALGRAFQKVNFLRDLAVDTQQLGRSYVPSDSDRASDLPISEADKRTYVAAIRADLHQAEKALAVLPTSARAGVAAAHDLYAELTNRLAEVPVETIMTERVSVPAKTKAAITAQAVARTAAQIAAKRRKR